MKGWEIIWEGSETFEVIYYEILDLWLLWIPTPRPESLPQNLPLVVRRVFEVLVMLARWKGRQAATGMPEVRPGKGPKEESVMNNWGKSEGWTCKGRVCVLSMPISLYTVWLMGILVSGMVHDSDPASTITPLCASGPWLHLFGLPFLCL